MQFPCLSVCVCALQVSGCHHISTASAGEGPESRKVNAIHSFFISPQCKHLFHCISVPLYLFICIYLFIEENKLLIVLAYCNQWWVIHLRRFITKRVTALLLFSDDKRKNVTEITAYFLNRLSLPFSPPFLGHLHLHLLCTGPWNECI